MILYLVRHGETLSNTRKIYAGTSDEDLTLRGRLQAETVARQLAEVSVDAVYSSPIRRARQTAEVLATHLNKRPILDESFAELRLGPWQGLSEDEVSSLFPRDWDLWNKRPQDLVLPDRETLPQLLNRVLEGVRRIERNGLNRFIVIVTHVAVIRVLHLYHNNIDFSLYRTIPVPNGKIFSIENLHSLSN